MSWSPSSELETLLNRLADESPSAEDAARVEEMLRGDAAARAHYRRFMELHAALHWDYAAAATPVPQSQTARREMRHTRWWRNAYAIAAVLAVLVAVATLVMPRAGERTIVSLEGLSGAVSWSRGAGGQRTGLLDGARLAEGTLMVEGEGASAQMRFKDGTLLMLSGESELAFSERGQKRLVLRRGTLSARVNPQPPGRPMLIRTPSAEAEVVGTEFAISAERDDTALNVESGTVKLRRLADGKIVEVAGSQSATASLNVSRRMEPAALKAPPTAWRRTLELPLPVEWCGRWLPATGVEPPRVMAMPYVAGRNREGAPVIHHGVSFRAEEGPLKSFVSVTPQSVLHFRCRMERPAGLKVFLSCMKENGGFGGNFESDILRPEQDGWQTIEVPLTRLAAQMQQHPGIEGRQVLLLLIHSINQDAGLEISEVSVRP